MKLMDPPGGLPWALIALCGSSLLLNVVLLGKLAMRPSVEAPAANAVGAIAVVAPTDRQVASANPAEFGEGEAAEAADLAVDTPEGVRLMSATVSHSLARTFQRAGLPDGHADVLNAVYARLFFWKLDLRRDLQKGDEIKVAYEWDGELAHIPVASYGSNKLGGTLTAYRFQATGDTFPSYWDGTGREVAYRLEESPLRNYEQVTSLLKDRPKHKGMDFKVPVGEDVVSPRSGTVTRTNWNLKYNGNCVEVKFRDGTTARFLHLSETAVKPGQRVGAGERVGASGNTGRSTAPHLHYELTKGNRVIDPVDYHGVVQRSLPGSDLAAFQEERARLDAILASASAI